MWRRRRETVATQGALLRQRAATQRALGATLRTEGHDVRTTARRVLAEALRSRQVAGISGAADAVRGVPAAAVARVSATRNPGRVHLVASAPRPTAAIRVLVVDDTEAVRRVLMRQLARAGHVVVGEAATVAAAVAAAATLTPDVVLLDLHLPDGLGTDAAARISARDGEAGHARRSPAIILSTGDTRRRRGPRVPRGAGWPPCSGSLCCSPTSMRRCARRPARARRLPRGALAALPSRSAVLDRTADAARGQVEISNR